MNLCKPRLIIGTLVCFLLFKTDGYLNAQTVNDINVSIGEDYRFPKKYKDGGITQLPSGEFIHLSQDSKNLYLNIQRLDSKSHLQKENLIELDKTQSCASQAVISLGGKVYWIYLTTIAEMDEVNAEEIDVVNCTLSGAKKKLATSSTFLSYFETLPFPQAAVSTEIQFASSPDKTKLLMWANYCPEISNDARFSRVGVFVFDSDFKELWNRKIGFATGNDRTIYRPLIVDNNGTAYTTLGTYNAMASKYKPIPDFFEVYSFSKDNGTRKATIRLPGKVVADALVANGNNGEIYVGGCYSKDRDEEAEGLFLCQLDKEDSLKLLSAGNTFSYKELNVIENNERKSVSMHMAYITQANDGKIYLFAEERNMLAVGSGNCKGKAGSTAPGKPSIVNPRPRPIDRHNDLGGSAGMTMIHNGGSMNPYTKYNDVVVACVNSDGKLQWINGAPKKQQGLFTPGGLSFAGSIHNGVCYVIYMDNIKNLDEKLGNDVHMQNDTYKSYLTVTSIDANGITSRKTLLTPKEYEDSFRMSRPVINENGKLTLFGYSGSVEDLRKLRLVSLSLP